MKRWIVLVAGLLLASQALAADSVRFGSKVITTGDSEEKVIQIAGKPVSKVEVQNVYGALRGYRLDYVQGRKTVQIYIAHGQVVYIKEIF
ncbi:MAG: DUF2845 domain-containing protein [Xanthomonadaceae bacterium]|nr:DUF2845 domain-containing protein [Xanthomonadaceae bacterium]